MTPRLRAGGRIAIGIVIGLAIGVIAVTLLGEKVLSLGRRSVWVLFILGVVIAVTEIVIMLQRIIP